MCNFTVAKLAMTPLSYCRYRASNLVSCLFPGAFDVNEERINQFRECTV